MSNGDQFYVYRLYNQQTDDFYLGFTSNPDKRKLQHFSSLQTGSHRNYRLQQSYYKNNNFIFEIISKHRSKDEAFNYEQFLISLSWGCSNLLNLDVYGVHYISEETKKKISERALEQMRNPANREISRQGAIKQWENPAYRETRCRKVSADNVTYPSIIDAANAFGISPPGMRKWCLNPNKLNYHFI